MRAHVKCNAAAFPYRPNFSPKKSPGVHAGFSGAFATARAPSIDGSALWMPLCT